MLSNCKKHFNPLSLHSSKTTYAVRRKHPIDVKISKKIHIPTKCHIQFVTLKYFVFYLGSLVNYFAWLYQDYLQQMLIFFLVGIAIWIFKIRFENQEGLKFYVKIITPGNCKVFDSLLIFLNINPFI